MVDERQRHEEGGISNCVATATVVDGLTSGGEAGRKSCCDGNTKDATDPPSTNTWSSVATWCVPPCEEQLYRLTIAGCVFAYLMHNLVDVNSRVLPMQAFGWLMLGLMASVGEQDGGRWVEWRVAGEKRRLFGLLMGLLVLVAGWAAVVQPVRAEYHEQVARRALFYGNLPKAAIHGAKSLEAHPYQLEMRFFYAGIFARWTQEDPARSEVFRKLAIQQAEELRKVAPDYDTVAIRLAFLYAQDGQKEKARNLAEWILKRRPKEKDALRLIELLEKDDPLQPLNTLKDDS